MKNPKEIIGDKLGIPKDIALDLPHITLNGNRELYIENYKSLLLYDSGKIMIGCKKYSVEISGKNMEIKSIQRDNLLIYGKFVRIDFKM